jgi:excinuclease ABC subunit C
VRLRVPQRGDKRALYETVERNAGQSLAQHKLRRSSDLTARSKALQEIADALGMDTAPLRIECYDISHIQGTDVVASMVVFEDGLARKSEYRRFAVRGNPDGTGTDDVSAMAEILRRRFSRYLEARAQSGDPIGGDDVGDEASEDASTGDAVAGPLPGIDPTTGRPRRFAYPPQLVVVDGAQPQADAAAGVLAELGIDDVAVCGLAKRLEEVWLPSTVDEYPVILPRTSEGLYLLQRVRDEAHRFAITYHRQRRSKRMTTSALDDVPGLGEVRRKALLRQFGSVKRLRSARVEEIAEVSGIGPRTAALVFHALHPDDAAAPNGAASPGGAPVHDTTVGHGVDTGPDPGTGDVASGVAAAPADGGVVGDADRTGDRQAGHEGGE